MVFYLTKVDLMVIISLRLITYWRLTMKSYSPVEFARPLVGLGRWDGEETVKVKSVLENSWAHTFRTQVYPLIPVEPIASVLFPSNNGRPSQDVTTSIGLMVIQEPKKPHR
jgi:hypothetical protein